MHLISRQADAVVDEIAAIDRAQGRIGVENIGRPPLDCRVRKESLELIRAARDRAHGDSGLAWFDSEVNPGRAGRNRNFRHDISSVNSAGFHLGRYDPHGQATKDGKPDIRGRNQWRPGPPPDEDRSVSPALYEEFRFLPSTVAPTAGESPETSQKLRSDRQQEQRKMSNEISNRPATARRFGSSWLG